MAIPFKYNLRNLTVRWVTSILTAGGIGLVTFVFLGLFAMGSGIEQSLVESGHPRNLIALRTGATAESQSIVTKKQVDDVLSLKGIETDAQGQPLVSAELMVVANLEKTDGKKANAAVRGVGPQGRELRGNIRIVQGRWFNPAVGELVVGDGAARRFKRLNVDDTIFFRGRDWRVVGRFTAEGQSFESEIWADIGDLKAQFKRDYSAILIRCANEAEMARLGNVIRGEKQYALDAKSHADYYRENNQAADMLKTMGSMMGVILAIGAVFGAANTMFTAVASRTREIATMRVLGFSRLSIGVSFVAEAALLGLSGGLAGVAIGYAILNGVSTGTVNWNTFSDMAFKIQVSPGLMLAGVTLAVGTGILGGLLPAYRASKTSLAQALRGL